MDKIKGVTQLQGEVIRLRIENEALQAQIDELMLEFCPEEMTQEQVRNWAAHQVAVKGQ